VLTRCAYTEESAAESEDIASGLESAVEEIGQALEDALPLPDDDPGHFTLEQLSSLVDMPGFM